MAWLVFSYSLPSTGRSSARVSLWRRLRTLGAVSPKGGVQVLPDREECAESFQWLAREVQQADGDALLMLVERFEGITDAELVTLFNDARKADYGALDERAAALEKSIATMRKRAPADLSQARESLAKLRRDYGDIARIDFFSSSSGATVAARLLRIEQALVPASAERSVSAISLTAYRTKRWVTRPGPYVDRLACAWLIRRFINPHAEIRYSATPTADEVPFDMSVGEFSHQGNRCSFETMMLAFELENPAMKAVAEIVHDIDLRDGRYVRPEAAGVEAVLRGWMNRPDADREMHGVALFDGLYEGFSKALSPSKSKLPSGGRSARKLRKKNR